MGNFWKIVNDVIRQSDIIIIVIDARLPDLTRNPEIENKVLKQEKKLLYVINKIDLVKKSVFEKIQKKLKPAVSVSSVRHYGVTILRKKIMKMSKGEKAVVGILGYPNVGKSSVINMLSGRGAARVAPISGHTTGMQKIKASGKILLLDTPGVIPYEEKDEIKQTLIGSINFDKTKDPEHIALILLDAQKDVITKHYQVEPEEDSYEIIEKIAIKRNKLAKGGIPDIQTISRIIIKDWQQGKISLK